MARVKTFRNLGRFDITPDLNGMQDDYDLFYSQWKTAGHVSGSNNLSAITTGTTFLLNEIGVPMRELMRLDSSERAAGARALQYRLVGVWATNQVAPSSTFTLGLHPLTITPGTSGNNNSYSVGAAVAGSTVAIAAPAASTGPTVMTGPAFAAPANGLYLPAVAVSVSSMAAGSKFAIRAELQYRQV